MAKKNAPPKQPATRAKSARTGSGNGEATPRLSTSDRWSILITKEMFALGPKFVDLGGNNGYEMELKTSDGFNLVPIPQSADLASGKTKYFTLFHEVKNATIRKPNKP